MRPRVYAETGALAPGSAHACFCVAIRGDRDRCQRLRRVRSRRAAGRETCPFRGVCYLGVLRCEQVTGGERREPGFAGQGGADGVEDGEPVGGGGVEVAANPAPAGEGGLGVPVPGDGLVPLSGFGSLFGDVVRSRCRLRVVRALRSVRIRCG